MEDIKEKSIFAIMVVIAISICIIAFYFMEFNSSIYYTQIDNTKIEKNSVSDDMKYKYTLKCYNENGKEKEIEFNTSRELREDAYLKLEVKFISGVHRWEEVQYNELPDKVKMNYKE